MAGAAIALASSSAGAAKATVFGSSVAYGVWVNLTGTLDLTLGALPQAGDGLVAPFDSQAMLSGFALESFLSVSANGSQVRARSDADGGADPRFADASASFADLVAQMVTDPDSGQTDMALVAASIQTIAWVRSDAGVLTHGGSATIEGGSLSLLDGLVSISLAPGIAPNTLVSPEVLAPRGIEVILNEQRVGGDGVVSRSFEVNAIHMRFADAQFGAHSLTGEVIFGHSIASLDPVPEPVPAWLAAGSLLVLAAHLVRNAVAGR